MTRETHLETLEVKIIDFGLSKLLQNLQKG